MRIRLWVAWAFALSCVSADRKHDQHHLAQRVQYDDEDDHSAYAQKQPAQPAIAEQSFLKSNSPTKTYESKPLQYSQPHYENPETYYAVAKYPNPQLKYGQSSYYYQKPHSAYKTPVVSEYQKPEQQDELHYSHEHGEKHSQPSYPLNKGHGYVSQKQPVASHYKVETPVSPQYASEPYASKPISKNPVESQYSSPSYAPNKHDAVYYSADKAPVSNYYNSRPHTNEPSSTYNDPKQSHYSDDKAPVSNYYISRPHANEPSSAYHDPKQSYSPESYPSKQDRPYNKPERHQPLYYSADPHSSKHESSQLHKKPDYSKDIDDSYANRPLYSSKPESAPHKASYPPKPTRDPKLPLYFTMYEKRVISDPASKYGKGPWRYLTYGHGITYGSKEPGKVFEKGYGYIRALGRDHCNQPKHLCPNRDDDKPFDYEGRKEPYFGYRPH